MANYKRIGELLMGLGLIDASQLQGALRRQRSRGGRLGENLVATHALSHGALMRALAQSTGVAEVSLVDLDRASAPLDLIPRELAERYNVVPLEAPDPSTLQIAIADPTDLEAQDTIAFITGRRVVAFMAPFDAIQDAIRRLYLGIEVDDDRRSSLDQLTQGARHGRKRLGELLVESGLITPSQLLAALERQRNRGGVLGESLVQIAAISQEELMRFLSRQLMIEDCDLSRVLPDPSVLALVPGSLCERLNAIPLELSPRGHLKVAFSDPTDLVAQDEISFVSGYPVDPLLAPYQAINTMIGRFYRSQSLSTRESPSDTQASPFVDMESYGGHTVEDDPDLIIFGDQTERGSSETL